MNEITNQDHGEIESLLSRGLRFKYRLYRTNKEWLADKVLKEAGIRRVI